MSATSEKVTTVTTICTVILRELRTERGLHQAQVAEWIAKTPSAWTKIESGKAPMQFEIFIRVCRGFQVWPSAVMATAERYASYLGQLNWSVISSELPSNEDDLLEFAQQYWGSPGCRNSVANRWNQLPVLNGPQWNADGTILVSAPFLFATNPTFRDIQLSAQEPPSLGF
ncbi:XRE family transcriptional regulator [Pseudomonas sp. Bc-h]|uniref:helix-turn-helix domain-containing protein n=1 Tax=Pseudomonas sp. Bc-h TaxID=1943632 RepID=UPI0009DAAA8C|nr:helix-turn-helix transcriptional regulator [Pseudomonas sp. Bc-h]OQR29716.1 XRE family transcriptional regulator [Pseudomonas sp. Bc-h]